MPTCVSCNLETEGGFTRHIVTPGTTATTEDKIPRCLICYQNGDFMKWYQAACAEFQASSIAFPSSGSFLDDLKTLRDALKSSARQEDGICPNGCAALVRMTEGDDFNAECPRCKFQLHSNSPITFLS